MSYRITRNQIEAQCDTVNRLLGLPDDWSYATDGAVHISGAYGGYAVHVYTGEHGGVRDLTGGHVTMRECSRYLSGMIEALRMVREA